MSVPRGHQAPFPRSVAEILLASSVRETELLAQSGSLTAIADDAQWIIVPISIERRSAARALSFLTLRLRIRRAMRRLEAGGVHSLRAYAVIPDLEDPTLVYELASPAADYARANLAWSGGSRLRWLRRSLGRMVGADVSTGTVLLAGRVDARR